MKKNHPLRTCFTRCPINYVGIFLSFIVEVMTISLFLMANTPLFPLATFVWLYILYAQTKLSIDIVEKCHDIVKANKVPTVYYYKNGTEAYHYTDYPFMGIMLLFIPAMIIGTFLMAVLLM